MLRNLKLLLATFLAIAGFAACGYHHESLAHPQIRSVAIGAIDNDSEDPRLGILMNEALKEAVMHDGSFRLVSVDEADVIITGRFGEIKQQGVGYRRGDSATDKDASRTYRNDSYRSNLSFDYKLATRKGLPIRQGEQGASAIFVESLDFQSDRREALKVACRRLAGKVVVSLSEGW
ncbi:MAG: hypothetical protein RL095_1946 [Verrucomicrobiota bacterium]